MLSSCEYANNILKHSPCAKSSLTFPHLNAIVFPLRNCILSVERMASNLPIPQNFNKVISHKERVVLLCFRP